MPDKRLEGLIERFERRDRLALARLVTFVENRAAEVSTVMERIYARTGHGYIIGITGAPGAGKSTLVNRLIAKYRAQDKLVAVLAIDPSSPFSGGAVLGDRVRMTDHYKDVGVYIRSLSSRGHHGGLSRAAREVVKLLDAFGHDVIIIETVGVGQTELSVMDLADSTVVVTVPEGGDGVQVMKAGLNEIADLFGIDGLVSAIERHREYRQANRDPAREQERRAHEFIEVLTSEIEERTTRALVAETDGVRPLMSQIRAGKLNPYSAARRIIQDDAAIRELLHDRTAKDPMKVEGQE